MAVTGLAPPFELFNMPKVVPNMQTSASQGPGRVATGAIPVSVMTSLSCADGSQSVDKLKIAFSAGPITVDAA